MLRRDYGLDCQSPEYQLFFPVAILLLFGFALLLPFSLAAEFVMNRKDLHSARTKSKIGWLCNYYQRRR